MKQPVSDSRVENQQDFTKNLINDDLFFITKKLFVLSII